MTERKNEKKEHEIENEKKAESNEIRKIKENNSGESSKFEISRTGFVAVLLALVFVIGAFQSMQLAGMQIELYDQQSKLDSLTGLVSSLPVSGVPLSQAAATEPETVTSSSSGLPSNLQNLPDMVGGC